MVKIVFAASLTCFRTSTSKYGRSSVAAGKVPMSQLEALSMALGGTTTPGRTARSVPPRRGPAARMKARHAGTAFMECGYSIRDGRRGKVLRSAASAEHGRNRAQEDLEVEGRRPVVDVLQVELHPAVEVDLVAAADLPEARQARLHRQPPAVPPVVRRDLLGDRRAGAAEAHVALPHRPEVRALIAAEPSGGGG